MSPFDGRFAWSFIRQLFWIQRSWIERIWGLGLVLGSLAVMWWSPHLRAVLLVLWGMLLLPTAIGCGCGWLKVRRFARLFRESLQLFQKGRYGQAVSLARGACDWTRRELGAEHPLFATSIANLANLYQAMGDHAAALPLYRQALEGRRAARGEAHPEFATSLNNLAGLYKDMGDHAAALPLYRQALEVRRAARGEAHPEFASSLNNLAGLYKDMGDHAAALPLYRQALEVRRATRGEAHPEFATSLNNLAGLCKDMGDHAAALPLYRQALEIYRAALGEAHPEFATSIGNLANLYQAMGDHAGALPLYRQALEVRRAALGEAHPQFAMSISNLANLYQAMGDHAVALPLCRQALEIFRAALGEAHPHFANSIANLANLYKAMGDHAGALPLYRQALEINRAALGEAHPEFASSISNLASLYMAMGDHAGALPLYRQALEVRRAALGDAHPHFAFSLNYLANLYQAMGDYAAALPLYRQALEINRAALGEAHPEFATSIGNLANLYQAMGDHAAALPFYRQALEIFRAALGETHPLFANSLNNLALLHVAMGHASEALPLMEQAAAIGDRMIGQVFSIGSERQRMGFLAIDQGKQHRFLTLVWKNFSSSREAVGAALSLVLRRKAVVGDSLAAQRDALLGNKYPNLKSQVQQWAALRMQIAQIALAGQGLKGAKAQQKTLEELNGQKERLEGNLARQIPEMNLEQQLLAADRRAVALALPEGVALVEFVRFYVYDFKAVGKEPRWLSPRYLAFVLIARDPDKVEMIDLGEAKPIDRLITDFRASVTAAGALRNLVRVTTRIDAMGTAGEHLRGAIFDPITAALGTCRRLALAPDGALNWLPFEVLPMANGGRLTDAYRISYVSVGRDLLRFRSRSGRQAAKPLVIADPDFDLTINSPEPEHFHGSEPPPGQDFWSLVFNHSETEPAWKPAAVVPPVLGAPAGRLSRDFDSKRYHFSPLPGTRLEGQRVAALLGVQPLLDQEALEELFKACRSPRIVHLATHGFFLPDQPRKPPLDFRDMEFFGSEEAPISRLAGPGMENPMLRSGLALAGANTFLKGGILPPQAEDGLLTAEDVAGLDLLDTDLVVLSACQTGIGEIQGSEGVFGLRRAFIVAGAKTLVMSLWNVPDLATTILMEHFYKNLLQRGMDRDLALRDAQGTVRKITIGQLKEQWLTAELIDRLAAGNPAARDDLVKLAQRHDDHRPFEHPFYWGAFICQGDPSPLPRPTGESS